VREFVQLIRSFRLGGPKGCCTQADSVNQNEQHKTDTEDGQRNEEMAIGENGFGLFQGCHVRGAFFQSVRANITGAGAALSRSAMASRVQTHRRLAPPRARLPWREPLNSPGSRMSKR
jgi:hypothetical protein